MAKALIVAIVFFFFKCRPLCPGGGIKTGRILRGVGVVSALVAQVKQEVKQDGG